MGGLARAPRSILVLVTSVVMASALVAVAGPAEAGRRPAPSHVSATADQASLTVRWRTVRKAPGYRVRWRTRHSMAGSHRLATTRHRARISGLAPDTRYFVQVAVAARKGHGRRLSSWSRTLARRTPPRPCPTQGNLGDPTPAPRTGQATDLRVATFNIRTINLDSAEHPEQRWRWRADRAAALLLGAATTRNAAAAPPDVIALQEANQTYSKFTTRCTNQLVDLRNRLNSGGAHHYEATSLNPSASVGTRILFDIARLRLEASGSVLLAPPETTHPHLAWAVFQARDGGQRFFFGSVHLVPNENAGSKTVRNAQWDRLLALLTDPALTQGLPVVLGGDFNARRGDTTNSAFSHLPQMARAGVGDMLLGDLDPANGELLVEDARPDAAANAHCTSGNGRLLQNCLGDQTQVAQQIDYLFASNSLPVKKWEIVLDLDGQNNWLGTIPSDHNLVRATVALPGVNG
jgi:endonuclease/exonuclease/phosphatase family metal-dependent hydrolase